MNNRQRFNATMHYQPRDRSPIYDFGFWDETLVVWREQGLPDTVDASNTDEYFGMDHFPSDAGVRHNVWLEPAFEFKVLEDRGEFEVVQQEDGVRVLRMKSMSTVPKHLSHLLVDRESWKQHYKPRLDPKTPARYPADWDEKVQYWLDSQREEPLALWAGSLYGVLRDWMGLENISLVVYDDPAWFEEMVTTLADLSIAVLSRILATGARFDGCAMWEDMAYSGGPLLSPKHFKKYLVPHYRRIADLMHSHGVDVIWIDCDGNIEELVPLWLDAGINCMFPFEVGVWGADPIQYRRRYGKDLLIMGGFNKRILARSKEDIEAEIYRLLPLIEEGGFISFCDHRVPPDVPLENHLFYLETARRVWAGPYG
jgi:uroporphyrinogen decarboxylase